MRQGHMGRGVLRGAIGVRKEQARVGIKDKRGPRKAGQGRRRGEPWGEVTEREPRWGKARSLESLSRKCSCRHRWGSRTEPERA